MHKTRIVKNIPKLKNNQIFYNAVLKNSDQEY